MEKRLLIPIATLLVACAVTVALAPMAAGQAPAFIEVIEIDDYEKAVGFGESVDYNWTLMNVHSDNLTVTVRAVEIDSGWNCTISPVTFSVPAGGLESVTATVTSPSAGRILTSNFTILFSAFKEGHLVQVSSFSILTNIEGVPATADKVLGLFENPLPEPLNNEWGVFLLDVILWFVIAVVVAILTNTVIRSMTKRSAMMIDDIILNAVRTPLLLLIFVYGVVNSLSALHAHIPADVISLLFTIYRFVLVVVLFYLGYKLFKQIVVYYGKVVSKRTASRVDDVLVPVVEKVGVVIIGIAALAYALDVLNVDLTMFVAGGVVVSMVLAFAAQETISNFFSGIFLLLDRPFSEGDTIILSDGDWCEVRRIGLRTTRLFRFSDATMVSIPNNSLVNDKIVRMTDVTDPARVIINVGVAYGSDPSRVREVILGAITDNPYPLMSDPKKQPLILFDELGDSALIFKVSVWLRDREKRLDARNSLVESIYRKLTEAGIEIPFPQRVVHIRKDPEENRDSENDRGGE